MAVERLDVMVNRVGAAAHDRRDLLFSLAGQQKFERLSLSRRQGGSPVRRQQQVRFVHPTHFLMNKLK